MSRDPTDPNYYASGSSPVPKFGFGIRMEGSEKQIKETANMFKAVGGVVKAPGVGTALDMFTAMKSSFESPALMIATSFFQAFGAILSQDIDYDSIISIFNSFLPMVERAAPLIASVLNPALERTANVVEDMEPHINTVSDGIERLTEVIKDWDDKVQEARETVDKFKDKIDDLIDIMERYGGYVGLGSGGSGGGKDNPISDLFGGLF